MWFLNPSKGLFKNPSKKENGPQRIFFPVSSALSIELLSSIYGSCRQMCPAGSSSKQCSRQQWQAHFDYCPILHTTYLLLSIVTTGPRWTQQHGVLPSHPQHPPGTNQQSDVWAQHQRHHDIIRKWHHLCGLYECETEAGALYLEI